MPVSYHCSNDFSYLNFLTHGTYLPTANNDIAVFTGEFTNNRGPSPITLTVIIGDNGEPGAGNDRICIFEGTTQSPGTYWVGGSNPDLPPPPHRAVTIDGGNFQVHEGFK